MNWKEDARNLVVAYFKRIEGKFDNIKSIYTIIEQIFFRSSVET